MVAAFGFVSGIAAILALVFIAIFFGGVPVFGPLNDIALLVMAVTIFPVLHWLGRGSAMTWVADAGLAVWCVLQALMILRLVDYDYQTGRSAGLVVSSIGLAVFGAALLVILLIGSPVTGALRWVGVVAAAGFLIMGLAIPIFGTYSPYTYAGGLAWQLGWPPFAIWLARNLTVANAPTPPT